MSGLLAGNGKVFHNFSSVLCFIEAIAKEFNLLSTAQSQGSSFQVAMTCSFNG